MRDIQKSWQPTGRVLIPAVSLGSISARQNPDLKYWPHTAEQNSSSRAFSDVRSVASRVFTVRSTLHGCIAKEENASLTRHPGAHLRPAGVAFDMSDEALQKTALQKLACGLHGRVSRTSRFACSGKATKNCVLAWEVDKFEQYHGAC